MVFLSPETGIKWFLQEMKPVIPSEDTLLAVTSDSGEATHLEGSTDVWAAGALLTSTENLKGLPHSCHSRQTLFSPPFGFIFGDLLRPTVQGFKGSSSETIAIGGIGWAASVCTNCQLELAKAVHPAKKFHRICGQDS
jgi:hypothetical protein